jgi:ubiquinone/menaquinone biosynthesis C-methylase UbiE
MADDIGKHWEGRYLAGATEKLGWYRPRLDASLELIRLLSPKHEARLIDVGGGASTLVDDLLAELLDSVTVLDLSPSALDIARRRLGSLGARVTWHVGSVLDADLAPNSFDIWHDRAVFHFLVKESERHRYLTRLAGALEPGGHVVIGAFSPDAPAKCSGLPIQRYTLDQMIATFGPTFRLVESREEAHQTPGGTDQPYIYALFEHLDRT